MRYAALSARPVANGRSRLMRLWSCPIICTQSLPCPRTMLIFLAVWRRIKGHFSQELIDGAVGLNRRPNGDLALWQRRYWEHTIRDENDFTRHADYIHFNPVKH